MGNKSKLRALVMLLVISFILSGIPAVSLAEGSFSAFVNTQRMSVYSDPGLSVYCGSLPYKTIVVVNRYQNGVAQITYQGRMGFASVYDMATVSSVAVPVITNCKTRVYEKASTSSRYVDVQSGLQVFLLGVNGTCAIIERNGILGYTHLQNLTMANQVPEITPPQPEDNSTAVDVVRQAVTNCNTRVYEKASTSSRYVNVRSGILVNVLGINGSCALVEKDGNLGFMNVSHLSFKDSVVEVEPSLPSEDVFDDVINDLMGNQGTSMPGSFEEAVASGKFTNEELCFGFAVQVMGYNKAAAAGLLANIKEESNFRTGAEGDSGRSFGICQWFSSRKTRLINWCESNGLDYTTLYGQLYFLKYELETHYPSVHRYMKSVENSADGAYDAAYYFCYNFEVPANRESRSQSRGNSARNTFYPKYA